MSDLVLHVGLPKTATTSLQNYWFRRVPNYLGKSKKDKGASGRGKAATDLLSLVEKAYSGAAESTLRPEVEGWRKQWVRTGSQMHRETDETPFLLSEEVLVRWMTDAALSSQWPLRTGIRALPDLRARPSPISVFLKTYKEALWPDGKIKILLTLRNQPDWLASLYSQISNTVPNAGQADFVQKVDALLASDDTYLDWAAWIDEMAEVVGQENVCALPMEMMSEPVYWERLNGFLSGALGSVDRAIESEKKENQRAAGARDEWQLRGLKFRKMMAQEAERFPAQFKKALIRAMGRLQGPLRPLINKTIDREREASIVLAPELRDRIIEVYGSSNRRLEKQIGIPLDKYGY